VFTPVGLAAPTVIAFGLVRRVRELVWVVVGLVIFAALRWRVRRASA
jgi:hypothetical protein